MESEKSAKKEKVEDTSSSAYETADPEAQAGSSTVEPNVVPEATKTEHVAVTVEVHEEQASTMKPAIAPKAKHVAGSDERSGEQGATSIVTQSDVSDISEAEHVAISIEVSAQEEAKALPVPVNPKFPRGPHKLTMLERYPVGRRFPSRTPKGDIIDVVFVADKESKSLASKLVDKGFPIAPHNSPAESSRNTPPDSETTSLQGDVDPTVEQTEETVLGVKIPHRHVDMATFKIIFLGDVGVGKTSLVMRFCDGVFLNNYYKTTIGVDFKMRMLKLPEVTCRLHVFDLAGRESCTELARVYYRNSHGAVIVFDGSSTTDLTNVVAWKKQLDETIILPDGKPLPCILVGNKSDIAMTAFDEKTVNDFLKTHGFSKFFNVSAKNNTGVSDAFIHLVTEILKCIPQDEDLSQSLEKVVLSEEGRDEPEKKSCHC